MGRKGAKRKRRDESGRRADNGASTQVTQFPTENAEVNVDGSLHEGGGQMLRTSIGLGAALQTSVHVSRIRAGRSNPGLRAQHLSGAVLTASLGGGILYGARVGAGDVRYVPSIEMTGEGTAEASIGTAGAVALVLQAALPAIISRAPKSIAVRGGGTHVPFAPTAEYVSRVLTPNAKRFGALLEYDVRRRGFFPRGGAIVNINVSLENGKLRPWRQLNRAPICRVSGVIVAGSQNVIDSGAATRMRKGARAVFRNRFGDGFEEISSEDDSFEVEVHSVDAAATPGPTLAITLVAETTDGGALGASRSLDRRGAKESGFNSLEEAAEHVGREMAEELFEDVRTGAAVDRHMADQVCTFMALAEGDSSIGVPAVTLHMKSVREVLSRFSVSLEFDQRDDGIVEMVCRGIGVDGKRQACDQPLESEIVT